MKSRLIPIVICIALTFITAGCATIRRHPVATAFVGAAIVGATVGIIQNKHNSCPSTYEGEPYQGTPWGPYKCPQYQH